MFVFESVINTSQWTHQYRTHPAGRHLQWTHQLPTNYHSSHNGFYPQLHEKLHSIIYSKNQQCRLLDVAVNIQHNSGKCNKS